MKRKIFLKLSGIAATVIGIGATLITDWVDEKRLDEKIEEKVNEAFARNKDEKES